MTDTMTNPADDGFEPDAAEVVDDQDADQVSDQANDDADSDDESEGAEADGSQDDEEETEEVERNGKKYRVPKSLKDDLLRQDDYTRKTQAVAEEKRALEAERLKWKETTAEIEDAKLSLKQVSARLTDLQALTEQDWQQLRAMDARDGTNRYDQFQRELLSLPRKEAEIKNTLDAKVGEVAKAQQEIVAKRVSEGQAILQRDIPGWGPELGAKLQSFVETEYGISADKHGEAFLDPALVKMAHAAYAAKQAQRKNTTLKQAETAQKVTPIKPARGGAVPRSGLHDDLPAEEWFRREREMMARRKGIVPKRA